MRKSVLIMLLLTLVVAYSVYAVLPVMQDVRISFNGTEVGVYATATDADNDNLKYECNLYRNESYLTKKDIYWQRDDSVRAGIYASYPTLDLDGTFCYNCTGTGYWEFIIGTFSGYFAGYYYNDSADQWQTDGGFSGAGSNIVNGLLSGSRVNAELMYNFTGDGTYRLFTTGTGVNTVYYWNGTSWVSDSSLVEGDLLDIDWLSTGFNVTGDGTWKMIASRFTNDNALAYYWNGSKWLNDSQLMCGICDGGATNQCGEQKGGYIPNLIYMGGITGEDRWSFVSRNNSATIIKTWNGTCWVNDLDDENVLTGIVYGVSPMDISYAFNVTGTGTLIALIGGDNRAAFGPYSIVPATAQGIEVNVINYTANYGESWVAQCRAHDLYSGDSYSAWMNGSLNRPPVMQAISDYNVTVGNDLGVQVVCSDPDGDPLSYWVNLTKISVNATGYVSDSPVLADIGDYDVLVTCGDGEYNDTDVFVYTVLWPHVLSSFINVSCTDAIPLEGSTVKSYCTMDVLSYDNGLTQPDVDVNKSTSQIDGSCTAFVNYSLAKYRSYCNVTMQYYDLPGYYDVLFSFRDTAFSQTVTQLNKSLYQYYQLLASNYEIAFEARVYKGTETTYSRFFINNTGNTVLATTQIKAYALTGAQLSSETLAANKFKVNSVNNSNTAAQLVDGSFVQIPSMSIGLHESKNFYLFMSIPEDQYPQMYYGTWLLSVQ